MAAYVVMLRGVNVGARNKIRMEALRALFVELGYGNVVSYIQSGNVVFDHKAVGEAALSAEIEAAIARDMGLDVKVLLRSRDELAKVVRANPFLRAGADRAKLHVTFCVTKPKAARVRALDGLDAGPDAFEVRGRDVYLHCPGGYGQTKLNNTFWERRLDAIATTRNWNTVTKLLDLAGGK